MKNIPSTLVTSSIFSFCKRIRNFQSRGQALLGQQKGTDLSRRLVPGSQTGQIHLDPFRFGQLNAFEKILLARKGPAQASSMARYVRDKWELIAPDPEKFDRLFGVALKTSALKSEETSELAILDGLQSDDAKGIVENSTFQQV